MQLVPTAAGTDTVVAMARYALVWTLAATIIVGALVAVLHRPRADPRLGASRSPAAFTGSCEAGLIAAPHALPPPATRSLACPIRVPSAQWSSRTPGRGG